MHRRGWKFATLRWRNAENCSGKKAPWKILHQHHGAIGGWYSKRQIHSKRKRKSWKITKWYIGWLVWRGGFLLVWGICGKNKIDW